MDCEQRLQCRVEPLAWECKEKIILEDEITRIVRIRRVIHQRREHADVGHCASSHTVRVADGGEPGPIVESEKMNLCLTKEPTISTMIEIDDRDVINMFHFTFHRQKKMCCNSSGSYRWQTQRLVDKVDHPVPAPVVQRDDNDAVV